MKVSVIIPTYNGAHKIVNALHSIEQQTVIPDEVLVIIDGSTDNTMDVLQNKKFKLNKLRLIEQENGGRAKVRNRGALEATGDLLIFLDDDMTASFDLVARHTYHHENHDQSILTGGLREPVSSQPNDFSRFRSHLNIKWSTPFIRHADKPMTAYNYYITAGNCSIMKSTFNRLNGFDERLNDAEDYDLATRAVQLAVPIYYDDNAWAYHNEFPNCKQYIGRLRQYTHAQHQLSLIKPELYGNMHQYRVVPPSGIKGNVFRMFCSIFWINSVDTNTWTWLPKNIRYKLYDIIITANGNFFPSIVEI